MIEISRSMSPGTIAIHLRGEVSGRDFCAFIERALCDGAAERLRVLTDWRELKPRSLSDWSVETLCPWIIAAGRIERVAIVHQAVWNRRAALLAAVLRKEDVLVRSWKPECTHLALQWLGLQLHDIDH